MAVSRRILHRRPSASRPERSEPLIDHVRRPEDRLREDRPDVFPEGVGLLPVVEQRAEDPEAIEGPTTRGSARAAFRHRPPPVDRSGDLIRTKLVPRAAVRRRYGV